MDKRIFIFIILIFTSTCFAKSYYKPSYKQTYNYNKNSPTKEYKQNNIDRRSKENIQQNKPIINNYNTGFVRSMVGTMTGMYLFNSFTNENEMNSLNYENNSNESIVGTIFGYLFSFFIILLFIYIFYRILKLFFKI